MADDLSARLRRLLEPAVPLPWVASFTERGDIYSDADDFSDEQVDMEDHMVVASDGGVLRIADADLICEAVNALPRLLDALDAMPPDERVLPEGVLSIRQLRRTLERSAVRLSEAGWDGLAWNCRELAVALSPDSGADPEPQRVIVDFAEVEPVQQHSPLRTWPTDPEPQP